MREFIGLNGHTVQFKPELYQPVCRLVRDYHPVEWDLGRNTAEPAPFPFAKNRVDWSKAYGSWREKNWTIISVTLDRTPGRLVASQRMPLTTTAASSKPTAKQNADGRIEAQLDESPLYLLFENP